MSVIPLLRERGRLAWCPLGCPPPCVDHGLSFIERDIAAHADHFVLTTYGNLFVHFALGIEPADRCAAQSSNRREMRASDVILFGKFQESGKSFIALIEDDRVLFGRFPWIQQLNLHLGRLAVRNGCRRRYVVVCRFLR